MPLQDLPFSILGCRPLEKVARGEARRIYSRVRLRVDKAVRVRGCMGRAPAGIPRFTGSGLPNIRHERSE
jgi:hypothetical protein